MNKNIITEAIRACETKEEVYKLISIFEITNELDLDQMIDVFLLKDWKLVETYKKMGL